MEQHNSKKITPEIEDIILKNTDKTVAELSEITGVNKNKIYYYINKNNIKVKRRKTSVEKYLENL